MVVNRPIRYQLCNIITADLTLIERSEILRSKGETHESIYRKGLELIEKEKSQQKVE